VNFTEALRTVTYSLRVQRRSGGLHSSIENNHLQSESAETSGEGQENFTQALRTATYRLRMQRQAEKVRRTSQKH